MVFQNTHTDTHKNTYCIIVRYFIKKNKKTCIIYSLLHISILKVLSVITVYKNSRIITYYDIYEHSLYY